MLLNHSFYYINSHIYFYSSNNFKLFFMIFHLVYDHSRTQILNSETTEN